MDYLEKHQIEFQRQEDHERDEQRKRIVTLLTSMGYGDLSRIKYVF